MTGDVTVYLRDGDYQISSSLNFGPRDSGNNGFNVIWASFPGEKAVLLGQAECVVEFTIGEQPSIGGPHRAAKLKHQSAVEIQPNRFRSQFTHWVRHGRPDRSRISC